MELAGRVSLYVGHVEDKGGRAPAVAVLVADDETPRQTVFFRVVFFQGGREIVVRGKGDVDSERGADTYAGLAHDSRGWELNWRVKMTDDAITGHYFPPNDHGKVDLHVET